jgi:Fe-S cluster biogenesis protein NfuA
MTQPLDGRHFQAGLQRLEGLVRGVERLGNPEAQAHARALVSALLELHGTALGRLLDHLAAAGEAGRAVLDACARDEAVGGLLLLHGLHPLPLEARVRQALDDVRPALRKHGGSVELLDVSDGVIRLRLEGNCHGCPSSAVTMRQTIEEAIIGRAPDAAAVEVEGLVEDSPAPVKDGPRVALPVV